VLEERKLPVANYYLFASKRSAGTTLPFMGETYTVRELTETCMDGLDVDIALFSAGAGTSLQFAPIVARYGAVVIDNSSCWRMNPDVPLVVPEVNPDAIPQYKKMGIIANPNCSTIQAVVALKPLANKYGLKRVVYSTYQAVSGAGQQGYADLAEGLQGHPPKKFPQPIAGNVLPQIDVFLVSGYNQRGAEDVDENPQSTFAAQSRRHGDDGARARIPRPQRKHQRGTERSLRARRTARHFTQRARHRGDG
jgi:aspartate-semialdehyde dehydrogenase